MLGRVELGNVDVDEAHPRMLEGGLGCRGEVRVAGADSDDEVGFGSDTVRRKGAGRPARSETQGMIKAQAPFPGRRRADRNTGAIDQCAEDVRCLAIDATATRDYERLTRLSN